MPTAEAILSRLEMFGVRLGLERIRLLLDNLGRPQSRYPVVLVAGTNGKGSTAALLASIAGAAGYRVGLYTSPHLEEVRERIRIGGLSITQDELDGLLARVIAAAPGGDEEPPTYFEALTAAACLAFADRRVDLAVLEVGLGGRLDATNACEPILSLVTSIALDHERVLGNTEALIAREKAGIFRPGVPVLSSVDSPPGRQVLTAIAAAIGAPFEDVRPGPGDGYARGVEGRPGRYRVAGLELESSLLGSLQVGNLKLAVLAAQRLAALGQAPIDEAAIRRGVARCRWPGRLELVTLPSGQRVLLDAAHNLAAAERLAAELDGWAGWRDRVLLFGTLREKPAEAMIAALAPGSAHIVCSEPEVERSWDSGAWWSARDSSLAAARREPDLARAIAAILDDGFAHVVIAGSVIFVGQARGLLRARCGVPLPAAEVQVGA